MKNASLVIFSILLIFSCGTKESDLIVKGQIKGLKKGTIYLQHFKDTTLIVSDSIIINGEEPFELHSNLESPEMFYLYLDKNSSEKDAIPFFADKGVTEINTTLKNFVFDAKIKGSKQQKVLEKYQNIMAKFNSRDLELIKENFEAQRDGDTAKLANIARQSDGALKRKYLYTVNFAISNNDSEVAPYLALTEIYNARLNLLDTINKSLTPSIKESKYGKKLQQFIDKRKKDKDNKSK